MNIRIIVVFIILSTLISHTDFSSAPPNMMEKKDKLVYNFLTTSKDYYIVKYYADMYSDEYEIPRTIVYKLLETETGWKETRKQDYVARRLGDGGRSLGPAQIQLKTAKHYRKDEQISRNKLLNNIQFNIETMCIILKSEYEYFSKTTKSEDKRWLYSLASYNMGRPQFMKIKKPNSYAKNIVHAYKTEEL